MDLSIKNKYPIQNLFYAPEQQQQLQLQQHIISILINYYSYYSVTNFIITNRFKSMYQHCN